MYMQPAQPMMMAPAPMMMAPAPMMMAPAPMMMAPPAPAAPTIIINHESGDCP